MSKPPKKGKRRGVAVSWLFPDKVAGEFCVSLANLVGYDQRRARRIENLLPMSSGPNLNTARNKQASEFLNGTSAAWLLIVDSDMVFDPDVLDSMFEVADAESAPIVGGLCFGETLKDGAMVPFPTLYTYGDDLQGQQVDFNAVPEERLVRVNGTGTGFLMIHYSVLEQVGDKFADRAPLVWFEEMVLEGRLWSEDQMFCLRAQQAGFPIHVDMGTRIGHVKRHITGLGSYLASRGVES